jgi:hypothetical protein
MQALFVYDIVKLHLGPMALYEAIRRLSDRKAGDFLTFGLNCLSPTTSSDTHTEQSQAGQLLFSVLSAKPTTRQV